MFLFPLSFFRVGIAERIVPINITRPPIQSHTISGCFVTCITIDLSFSSGGSNSATCISSRVVVLVAGDGTSCPDAVKRSIDGLRVLVPILISTTSWILLENVSRSDETYVTVVWLNLTLSPT